MMNRFSKKILQMSYRFVDANDTFCVFFLFDKSPDAGGDIGELVNCEFNLFSLSVSRFSFEFSFRMIASNFLWFGDCGPISTMCISSAHSNLYCSSFLLPFKLNEIMKMILMNSK